MGLPFFFEVGLRGVSFLVYFGVGEVEEVGAGEGGEVIFQQTYRVTMQLVPKVVLISKQRLHFSIRNLY